MSEMRLGYLTGQIGRGQTETDVDSAVNAQDRTDKE
jgi:hypothetical protein